MKRIDYKKLFSDNIGNGTEVVWLDSGATFGGLGVKSRDSFLVLAKTSGKIGYVNDIFVSIITTENKEPDGKWEEDEFTNVAIISIRGVKILKEVNESHL